MANRREKEQRQRKVVSAKKWAQEHESGFSRTSLKIPDGVQMLNIKKAGTYRLDVIPYTVGEGNPHADAGELHYERTYWVHARIGPNADSYICSAKTFGKTCPICEARAEMARDPDSDSTLVKALFPKERNLWNVFVHSEPEKGVQVWDISDHLFGKHLRAKIINADETDGYDTFADPVEGQTLKIGATEEKGGGYTWRVCNDIEFKQRKESISDELMEAATCLDDMPIEMDYDELKEIFLGKRDVKKDVKQAGKAQSHDDDDEPEDPSDTEDDDSGEEEDDSEEDDKPAPKKKAGGPAAKKGISLGSVVTHEEYGKCDVVKVSPDGTSITLEDEDGEVYPAIDPNDCEVIVKGKKKPAPPPDDDDDPEDPSDTEDEDDDSGEEDAEEDDSDVEDSDDDDEPPPPKKKAVAKAPAKKPVGKKR